MKNKAILSTLIAFIFIVVFSTYSCKKDSVTSDQNIFVQVFPKWPPTGGVKYYEIQGDKLYYMEDMFLSGFKRLFFRNLTNDELKKVNEIIAELESSSIKSRYVENSKSETASEYRITLRIQNRFRDIQIFQDSIQGELAPLLLFINSIKKESFDTIFDSSPAIQNMYIGSVINHYNDTISINPYTKFNIWKQLVINEVDTVKSRQNIPGESYDYRFTFGYDLGYFGDSICKIGVINNNIYLTSKTGVITVVKDVSCRIQPLLY